MPEIKLKIEDLILDQDNPRITHADGQQEALQKVVKEQKTKLVKLAQSIVERGLNPMDRFLVLRLHQKPERFIALEGNRRVAVFKLLTNPAVMSGLDMPASMKTIFERLAGEFGNGKQIEPIAGFEMGSRQEGEYWLTLRHKGEQGGAGIVDWNPGAQQRFASRTPAVQALDMVIEHGGLTAEQSALIATKFPLSTLQRFVEDKTVRSALGLSIKAGKLVTNLPAPEVLKPLKRIVLDLATKTKKVGDFMKTEQMIGYIGTFDKKSAPDLTKATGGERAVDDIPSPEFGRPAKTTTRRKPDPSDRGRSSRRGALSRLPTTEYLRFTRSYGPFV